MTTTSICTGITTISTTTGIFATRSTRRLEYRPSKAAAG